jgi:hypothetical protein
VTSITQARYGRFHGKPACLFVFTANFVPYYDVRFKYVEVELRIVKSRSQSDATTATFIAYEPKNWQGRRGAKTIQHSQHLATNTGLATQATIGVNAGVGAGVERNVEFTEMKRAWLDSELEPSTVKWRLCENDTTREGVPKPFQGALIIGGEDGINIRMKYYVKLSKSSNPLSWAVGHARMAKPLSLDRATVGDGVGAAVDDINEMEKNEFKLGSFVIESWDL